MSHYDARPLVEYAKSGRATCKKCYGSIGQDTVRVGIKSRSQFHDGFDTNWVHLRCFRQAGDLESVIGAHHLRYADQVRVQKALGVTVDDKKPEEKRRKRETERLWQVIDEIGSVKAPLLKRVMDANGLKYREKANAAELASEVANRLVFGLAGPCPECKMPMLKYYVNDAEMRCRGDLSGFTKCSYKCEAGKVDVFDIIVPQDLGKPGAPIADWKATKNDFPRKQRSAAAASVAASSTGNVSATASAATVVAKPTKAKPLDQLMVAVHGGAPKTLGKNKAEVEAKLAEMGGTVVVDVEEGECNMVLTTAAEAKKPASKRPKKVTAAKTAKIPVISYDYITALVDAADDAAVLELRTAGGMEPFVLVGDAEDTLRVKKRQRDEEDEEDATAKKAKKGKGAAATTAAAAAPAKKTPRAPKDGSDILKLCPRAHVAGKVYVADGVAYNAMLNQTDVATGANKFYQLQIIQRSPTSCTLVLDYGRIGSNSGYGCDTKTYSLGPKQAIKQFEDKFKEKTRNSWKDRDSFAKQPGKYNYVPLDDGWGDEVELPDELKDKVKVADSDAGGKGKGKKKAAATGPAKCKLPESVQAFVERISDAKMMTSQLESMKIDTKKMPLGKLNRKVILQGMQVLCEVEELLKQDSPNPTRLIDCSNRFYAFIPHTAQFGQTLPQIDSMEKLKEKTELLESMLDIEQANKMMAKIDTTLEEHPTDQKYAALKLKLTPLDKKSERFQLLVKYVKNTHASTHSTYTLEPLDIFEVDREGEADRFAAYSHLDNHQLLWHGSRVSNWVGILSTGLRIAPPEAPVTGYMFGKGIYFADMVSKSANYCATSPKDDVGVLTLAQVALGEPKLLTSSDSSLNKSKLGKKFQHTKGQGRTAPDEKDAVHVELESTKVKVPVGKGVDSGVKNSHLLYNEYITYTTEQVRMRYVFVMKFKYKKGSGWW